MNNWMQQAWAHALATDAPALPALWLTQVWLSLGWSVVLAWLGAVLIALRSPRPGLQVAVAVVLLVWTWLPGPWSPDYWLGLAFRAPSLLTVLLCAWGLWRRLLQRRMATPSWGSAVLVWGGVLLGWALLLDAFALLPVQLYAWGFSPMAVAVVGLLVLLPWAMARDVRAAGLRVWAAPMALFLFMALRLPTGNVWDALLDPWLWLALHVFALRRLIGRY